MATLGNPKNTIEVLQKYNFNFQKKFGQNFLINAGILEEIIENNKKGKSNINPIRLVDKNNRTIESVQLNNGGTYLIKKTLINDNQTHIINQSSILIMPVAN